MTSVDLGPGLRYWSIGTRHGLVAAAGLCAWAAVGIWRSVRFMRDVAEG